MSMMKKSIIVSMLLLTLLFPVGCQKDKNTSIDQKNPFDGTQNELNILAEIPEKNIRLYYQSEEAGMYKNLVLKIEDREKIFYWESVSSETYAPRLMLADLNEDKQKDLIIILTKATGTGVNIQEVHVIDVDKLQEVAVESPMDIIKKNVKTKLSMEEIEITINKDTIKLGSEYIDAAPENLFSDVAFGNIVNFEIEDNKLTAIVPGQISPSSFIGEVKILYAFQDNMYVMNNIMFIPN